MFGISAGKKTILNVEGMSCEHCQKAVTEALNGVSGVKKAKVSLKEKNAVVTHDEAASIEAMKAAVTEAGFSVV
ncbi:MAG: copper ion binding protein [Termitinemataceae bacterium]|nr:MAG: copper ion binding protein [Termitinemataceae bacterium]